MYFIKFKFPFDQRSSNSRDNDKNSENNTDLPHMLPTLDEWNEIVSNLGISNDDQIIIYDNSDVISSCRCWYNFIYFGHNPKLVHVLNGGLKKWIKENKEITNDVTNIELSDYKSFEKKELVKNKEQVDLNIEEQYFKVIDARSKERFDGKVPEPRKGLRSGSIKNSFCIPFNLCLCEDKTFKNKKDLSSQIPFGPYLIIGNLVFLIFNEQIRLFLN